MILCDPELNVGLNTPGGGGNTGVVATARGRGRGAWTPVGVGGGHYQLGTAAAADAAYDVFGHEDARELAGKGHEIALKVKEGFSGIAQEMYKVCRSFDFNYIIMRLIGTRSQHLPKMICSSYLSHLILPTVRVQTLLFLCYNSLFTLFLS
jgi:hypothetical protein